MFENQEVNELAAIIYGEKAIKGLSPNTLTKEHCSGRSTALMFKYISDAMTTPNVAVKVQDHHGHLRHHQELLAETERTIEKLGLKFFKFSRLHNTVTFAI